MKCVKIVRPDLVVMIVAMTPPVLAVETPEREIEQESSRVPKWDLRHRLDLGEDPLKAPVRVSVPRSVESHPGMCRSSPFVATAKKVRSIALAHCHEIQSETMLSSSRAPVLHFFGPVRTTHKISIQVHSVRCFNRDVSGLRCQAQGAETMPCGTRQMCLL